MLGYTLIKTEYSPAGKLFPTSSYGEMSLIVRPDKKPFQHLMLSNATFNDTSKKSSQKCGKRGFGLRKRPAVECEPLPHDTDDSGVIAIENYAVAGAL